MTDKILETHALFIDTSAANKESLSRGDDFELHLNTQSIDADMGQFIRITLNEFSMYKTCPHKWSLIYKDKNNG